MIQIDCTHGIYMVTNIDYDDAVKLAAQPGAWFDVEYEVATGRGRITERKAFPASTVVEIKKTGF